MAAGLNSPRTLIALACVACCGSAHGFEPLTLAGESPLQVQMAARAASLAEFD